jgi:hypothetical protein
MLVNAVTYIATAAGSPLLMMRLRQIPYGAKTLSRAEALQVRKYDIASIKARSNQATFLQRAGNSMAHLIYGAS